MRKKNAILHTFSSSDNWYGGAADRRASILFSSDMMHANNLACWPSAMSWPMFREAPKINR